MDNQCVSPTHRATIVQKEFDKLGNPISDAFLHQDVLSRPFATATRRLTGGNWDNTYSWSETAFDELGRMTRHYSPCVTVNPFTSCKGSFTSFAYDLVGRLVQRIEPMLPPPIDSAPTTNFTFDRCRHSVSDTSGASNTRVSNVDGSKRQIIDANGHAINFSYDAAGSMLTTTDDSGRQLLKDVTVKYGVGAFPTDVTDSAHGPTTRTFNSLGELVAWTDAKGQIFSMTYDALSRPLTRKEPDDNTKTVWEWGAQIDQFNRGRLKQVSSIENGDMYTESFTYDYLGRPKGGQISIPVNDNTESYEYVTEYNPTTGFVESMTYPVTVGTAVKLKYEYQNGMLQKVLNGASSGTLWSLGSTNARGQITGEKLGDPTAPTIVVNRDFNPDSGRLNSIHAGPSSNDTALQNASYQFDEVGNLIQRQNNKLLLTENFVYGDGAADKLHRLRSSTVTNSGGSAVPNFGVEYDARGTFKNQSQPGTLIPPIDQTINWTTYNYPSSITAVTNGVTETATFSYGPARQRWKMEFKRGTAEETTYYIGGLLEKVVTSAGATEYRHSLRGASGVFGILTRSGSGTDVLRYLLTDHQQTIDTIADSAGAKIANESFTAFGMRRDASDWVGDPTDRTVLDGLTRQGYTYHTVLGSMGLNHMNGRVQDAVTGQFLSPDPFISDPNYTQNYNRYSYVYNRPLTSTDPSGFCEEGEEEIPLLDGEIGPPACRTVIPVPGTRPDDIPWGSVFGVVFDPFDFDPFLNLPVTRGATPRDAKTKESPQLQKPSYGACEYAPLNESDTKLALEILADPRIGAATELAWQKTLGSGNEHGFLIYGNSGEFRPGVMNEGTPLGLRDNYMEFLGRQADGLSLPVASLHTHPGNYPNAQFPSTRDVQLFNKETGTLGFIKSRFGLTVGRICR